MPGPLYARYVPPKASKTPIQPEQTNPDPVKTSNHTPTPQLYARYVPPKTVTRTKEPPVHATLENERTVGDDTVTNPAGRKRKRKEETYAHKDRKALIDSLSAPEIDADQSNGPSVDSKKERKDRKDQQRKSRKAEAIKIALEAEDANLREPQHKGASPEAVDSILAKYSVTGGARRNAILTERSHTKPREPLEVGEQDKNGIAADEMEVDAEDGNQDNDGSHYEEDAAEEITPAGVEAIFQKYRRSTKLAAADHSEGIPNANARRAKEKQERELAEVREEEQEREPELHGRSNVPLISQRLICLQVWNLFRNPHMHPRLLTRLPLIRCRHGLQSRQLFPLMPLFRSPT
jgi:hypothetical protein